jgi:hypothetical protein
MGRLGGGQRRDARHAVLGEELEDDHPPAKLFRVDLASVERRAAKRGERLVE